MEPAFCHVHRQSVVPSGPLNFLSHLSVKFQNPLLVQSAFSRRFSEKAIFLNPLSSLLSTELFTVDDKAMTEDAKLFCA